MCQGCPEEKVNPAAHERTSGWHLSGPSSEIPERNVMAKVVPFFHGRPRVAKPIFLSLNFFLTDLPLQGYHTGKGGSSRQSVWLGDRESRVRAQTLTGQYSLSCDRYTHILQTCYKTVCVRTEPKSLCVLGALSTTHPQLCLGSIQGT